MLCTVYSIIGLHRISARHALPVRHLLHTHTHMISHNKTPYKIFSKITPLHSEQYVAHLVHSPVNSIKMRIKGNTLL